MPDLAEPRPARARPHARWTDLRQRVISAAILAPLGIGAIALGGPVFSALAVALAIVMAGEWAGMCRLSPWRWPGLGVSLAAAPAVAAAGLGAPGAALPLLAAGAAIGWVLGGRERALAALGIAYVGAGAASLAWLRADPVSGLANVIFLVLLVWASDTGAFVVGRLVGGPRLAPRISPGKTWSGAAGGLVAAMAAGACLGVWFDDGKVWHAALVAGGLGVAAQAGDLLESAAKRHFGVKDSGRLIPGHGGLLDRLDAMMAVGPIACMVALDLGRGVALWR